MQFHGKGIEVKTLIEIIHERLFSLKTQTLKFKAFHTFLRMQLIN